METTGEIRVAADKRRPLASTIGLVAVPVLADDFENQLAAFGRGSGDAEGVLDARGGVFEVVLAGVVKAAEDAAFLHLLADFDFEDDADRGVDDLSLIHIWKSMGRVKWTRSPLAQVRSSRT